MKKTVIIYIVGLPGCGKYTIAKKFEKENFIICDNHLINNPIFYLLKKNNNLKEIPNFARQSIRKIRKAIFYYLEHELENNYVLTNFLGITQYDKSIYNNVKKIAQKRNSIFIPVILTINKNEHVKRITNKKRVEMYKTIDPAFINMELINIKKDKNILKIDISSLTPEEVKLIILKHIEKIKNEKKY